MWLRAIWFDVDFLVKCNTSPHKRIATSDDFGILNLRNVLRLRTRHEAYSNSYATPNGDNFSSLSTFFPAGTFCFLGNLIRLLAHGSRLRQTKRFTIAENNKSDPMLMSNQILWGFREIKSAIVGWNANPFSISLSIVCAQSMRRNWKTV